MEKKMETTIMENQMEKNMENEMETGIILQAMSFRCACTMRDRRSSEEQSGRCHRPRASGL